MTFSAASWIDVAEKDLDAVRRGLVPDPHTNNEIAAYHCQQAAEKLMKALLVYHGIAYPRGSSGHDLASLVARLPNDHPLRDHALALVDMTPWATAFRYPVDDPLLREPVPDVPTLSSSLERLVGFRDAVRSHVTAHRYGN